MKTKEIKVVKIYGKEIEISTVVYNAIHSAVNKNSEENEVVSKSEDVTANINNRYYDAKKYVMIYPSITRAGSNTEEPSTYSVIFDEVEDVINDTSSPREYESDITTAKKYLKHVVSIQNNTPQNEDTWDKDFKAINEVPDDVMEKINYLIYNIGSIDEYNKPNVAEDYWEFYNHKR